MLELLTATRYYRQMSNGRTGPLLLAAEDDDGKEIEVVAKFSKGADIGAAGLAREALCAMLAIDLGLPVPHPYLIRIEPEFIASVRLSDSGVAAYLAASLPIGFGSCKLPPGFSAWMRDRAVAKDLRQVATEILAFDLLIQNPDRRADNPNLECKGDEFAIFDHEMALITEGVLFWKPPWTPGGLSVGTGNRIHVLHAALKGKSSDLARLTGAWEAIRDERFASYLTALPPEWNNANAMATTAVTYLRDVRDNIKAAMDEVRRVLA